MKRVLSARAMRDLNDRIHYWCPSCGVPEAFHPEACPITPKEWRDTWRYAVGIGVAIASGHGRRVMP